MLDKENQESERVPLHPKNHSFIQVRSRLRGL